MRVVPTPDPRRTCVGCRQILSPSAMVRVVRTDGGELAIGRNLPGRGAWICADSPACWHQAVARGGFARSFRTPVDRGSAERLVAVLLDRGAPNVKD